MIRLIASDLDGTLLLNGAQQLSCRDIQLISELMEKKHIFFVAASGRQLDNLMRLFAPIRNSIGYICENGCFSYLNGEILRFTMMDRELGREVIRDIVAYPGAEVLLSGIHTSYLMPKDPSFLSLIRDTVKNHVTVTDDILSTKEPYFKISVYEKSGVLKHQDYWKARYGDRLTVVTGGNCWLDMMPAGVNKRTGLEPILNKLGISPDECMMFGDNENDRELLDYVGYPVVMDTSVPAIRESYPCHTDTVGHALEQIVAGTFPEY